MLSIEACYELLLRWAALSLAVGGSAVIALCLTREPVRRIRIIQGTLVGLALLPLLMIVPGYPRWAVLPDVGRLDNLEEASDTTLAEWQSKTVDSPPHPEPLPRGEREILLPSPLVGEGGLRSKPGEGGTADMAETQGHLSPQVGIPSIAVSNAATPIAAAPPHPDPLPRGEREKTWSYRDAIVAAYLAGLLGMLAWTAVGLVAVWRLLRTARPAPLECRILLKSLGGPRTERVALVVSPRVAQPCAVAGWRTTIVLPEALVQQQDPRALRWALAHEWSHVQRHDLPWWLASGIVRAVYFYQPLVWWLRGQLQLSQDYLADGAAAGLSHSPEDYAEFLTTSSFTRPTLAAGLGIGGRISDLQRRVVMLVDRRRPLERVSPRSWNLATIVAVTLVVGMAAGLAPEEPRAETGGERLEETATQAAPTPAPLSASAPTAAPASGAPQPDAESTKSTETKPAVKQAAISASVPDGARKIQPGDTLSIEVLDNLEQLNQIGLRLLVNGRQGVLIATVNSAGGISLGSGYGGVKVAGKTLEDAGATIDNLLRQFVKSQAAQAAAISDANNRTEEAKLARTLQDSLHLLRINVRVNFVENGHVALAIPSMTESQLPPGPLRATGRTAATPPSVPDAKRKIQPGDVLSVVVLDNLDQLPALGSRLLLYPKTSEVIATVDSEGEILLGTRYGTVKVADMTLLQASAFVSNVIQEYIRTRGNQERQRIAKTISDATDATWKGEQQNKAQAIEDALRRLEVNVRVSLAGTGPERTPIPTQTYAPATALPGVAATSSAPVPVPVTAPANQLIAAPASPAVSPYLKAIAAQPPDTIIPGDVLNIESSPDEAKVKPVVTVEPDGRIALGVRYGRVHVGGKSLSEAEQIVQKVVADLVQDPQVQITFEKRGRN